MSRREVHGTTVHADAHADSSAHAGINTAADAEGASTIWVLAAMSLVLLVGLVAVFVGSACVARHRAESAADLAALAGAARSAAGGTDGCARAAGIAAANGARLSSCLVIGGDVLVTVHVAPVGLPEHLGDARAQARAGPVDTVAAGTGSLDTAGAPGD